MLASRKLSPSLPSVTCAAHTRFVAEAVSRGWRASLVKAEELGRTWLIQRNYKLVGYVILALEIQLRIGGRDGLIDELCLVPEDRGKEFGTLALELIERAPWVRESSLSTSRFRAMIC